MGCFDLVVNFAYGLVLYYHAESEPLLETGINTIQKHQNLSCSQKPKQHIELVMAVFFAEIFEILPPKGLPDCI